MTSQHWSVQLVKKKIQTCTCVAGKVACCNRTSALLLKMCKYSLYDSKTTDALKDEADKNEAVPCTSQLQAWHKRGR